MNKKQYRLFPHARTCLWYTEGRDQVLIEHEEQDRLEEGKIALEVPESLKWMFTDKGIDKVYANYEDLYEVKEELINET